MAKTTSLGSTGTSSAVYLDPVYKETVFQVTVTAASSGTSFVQVTLDDLASTPAPTVSWATLSSGINSSAADGVGQALAILTPITGARLLVQSSTTTGVVGTTTLKVLQSVTG